MHGDRHSQMSRRTAMAIVGAAGILSAVLPRRVARALGPALAKQPQAGLPRGANRARLAGQEVRAYFGRLTPGTRVGDATIAAVHDVHFGAIPVVLRLAGGRTVQVDVVRRGAGPSIASSSLASLQLVNRADGVSATDESAGLATMALARALAEREAQGAQLPALMTHAERSSRFPRGRFHV